MDTHRERCWLWYNNNLIADDFAEPLHLNDGDYMRILIGEHDSDFQCDDTTEESADFVAGLQVSADVSHDGILRTLPLDMDPMLFLKVCDFNGPGTTPLPVLMSVDDDADPPAGDPQRLADPTQGAFDRPPGIDQPTWVHEVWDLLVAHGVVEFAEEGPIMYLRSHYISHRHHHSNRASRPLRFDTDFETWEADIRFMWEDFLDPGAFELVFVSPQPTYGPTIGTSATVLVVQHPVPGRAACLVSHPRVETLTTHNEIALSMAVPCTPEDLLHSAGLAEACTQFGLRHSILCEILVGSTVQTRELPLHLHEGLGLRVQFRSMTESELALSVRRLRNLDETDETQLWTHHWMIQTQKADQIGLHSQVADLQRCLTTSMRVLEDEETTTSIMPITAPEDILEDPVAIDRFPAEQEDLVTSWRSAASISTAIITEDGETKVKFVTWFLNGDRWPRCDAYRVVALPADLERWEALFRQRWHDRVDPAAQLHVSLVYPPVTPDNHGGHLILHQGLGPTVRGTLISVFWHGQDSELSNRFAQVVPHWLSFQRFLHFADLFDACRRQILLCVGFSGSHPIEDDRPLFPRHGSHIEIHAAEMQLVDETSIMQQPGPPQVAQPPAPDAHCEAHALNAAAPIFVPGLPWAVASMSEFTQDLHVLWTDNAFAWEDESPSCVILVWFVDHRWHAPHGRVARSVRLYDDFHNWEEHIRRAWADHIVEGAVIELHLVTPPPPAHRHEAIAHVVLIQHPNEVWVTSVVSWIDSRGRRPAFQQLAITTHEHILIDNLLRVFGIHEECLGPRAQFNAPDNTALFSYILASLFQVDLATVSSYKRDLDHIPGRQRLQSTDPTELLFCCNFPTFFSVRC